jgi:hypothetical protein
VGASSLWRYVKAAFWRSPGVPGLGQIPLNVTGVIGLLILGFGHPAIWLLGLAGEAAYLALCATNPRFQKLVQVLERQAAAKEDAERQESLIETLSSSSRARLRKLEESCERLLRLTSSHDAVETTSDSKAASIKRLAWLYLKLLVARDHLESADAKGDATQLEGEREQLAAELGQTSLSASLRNSKEATLRIVKQRLVNVGRHAEALAEIESDLKRIEAQVKLALEESRLKGDTTISLDVDLESELLEDSYGAAGSHVAALDRRFTLPVRSRTRS